MKFSFFFQNFREISISYKVIFNINQELSLKPFLLIIKLTTDFLLLLGQTINDISDQKRVRNKRKNESFPFNRICTRSQSNLYSTLRKILTVVFIQIFTRHRDEVTILILHNAAGCNYKCFIIHARFSSLDPVTWNIFFVGSTHYSFVSLNPTFSLANNN